LRRLIKLTGRSWWLPEKEEAPDRVTRASYAETFKKQLSEIGSLSLR